MYFLLFLLVIFLVYLNTFKNEFNQEDLGKATLFLAVGGLGILIISILTSL